MEKSYVFPLFALRLFRELVLLSRSVKILVLFITLSEECHQHSLSITNDHIILLAPCRWLSVPTVPRILDKLAKVGCATASLNISW